MRQRLILLALLAGAGACGGPEPPEGVPCPGARLSAADPGQLDVALGNAQPGDCVLLASGSYPGHFRMGTPEVTLAAERGAQATLQGAGNGPVVLDVDANGAVVHGLSVTGDADLGVLIRRGDVALERVDVFSVREAAVGIRCEDQDCVMPALRTRLTRCALESSGAGVVASGAGVLVEDTTIRGHGSQQLALGGGIYGFDGARLELVDTAVEQNRLGVLLDGASTAATLDNASILANDEAGLWAQSLRGTAQQPALRLDAGTVVSRNGVVGLGLWDATGAVVSGARLVNTATRTVQLSASTSADIGDGVALFAGSGEVRVEASELAGNGRAQAVVNAPGAGVAFAPSNTVNAPAGALLIQVQGGGATVQAPPADLSNVPAVPVLGTPQPVPAGP